MKFEKNTKFFHHAQEPLVRLTLTRTTANINLAAPIRVAQIVVRSQLYV
jgi:hypothetical protein